MLIKEIVKRGTSNYILMPKDLMDILNLELGDKVELTIENKNIIVSPIKKESKEK